MKRNRLEQWSIVRIQGWINTYFSPVSQVVVRRPPDVDVTWGPTTSWVPQISGPFQAKNSSSLEFLGHTQLLCTMHTHILSLSTGVHKMVRSPKCVQQVRHLPKSLNARARSCADSYSVKSFL